MTSLPWSTLTTLLVEFGFVLRTYFDGTLQTFQCRAQIRVTWSQSQRRQITKRQARKGQVILRADEVAAGHKTSRLHKALQSMRLMGQNWRESEMFSTNTIDWRNRTAKQGSLIAASPPVLPRTWWPQSFVARRRDKQFASWKEAKQCASALHWRVLRSRSKGDERASELL